MQIIKRFPGMEPHILCRCRPNIEVRQTCSKDNIFTYTLISHVAIVITCETLKVIIKRINLITLLNRPSSI
jgi:hypothetical protein